MKTVKHVATSNYCETCTRLEEVKDKVREDGKTRHCSCTCSAVEVWVVKDGSHEQRAE